MCFPKNSKIQKCKQMIRCLGIWASRYLVLHSCSVTFDNDINFSETHFIVNDRT